MLVVCVLVVNLVANRRHQMRCEETPLSWHLPESLGLSLRKSNIESACLGLHRSAGSSMIQPDSFIADYPGEIVNGAHFKAHGSVYAVSLDIKAYSFVAVLESVAFSILNSSAFQQRLKFENAALQLPFNGSSVGILLPREGEVCPASRVNDKAFMPGISVAEYEERAALDGGVNNARLLPVLVKQPDGSYALDSESPIRLFATTRIEAGEEIYASYGADYWQLGLECDTVTHLGWSAPGFFAP